MALISSLRPRRIVSFKYSFATLSLWAIYHSGRASRTLAKVSPLGSRLLPSPLTSLFSRLKFERPWVRDTILQDDSRSQKFSDSYNVAEWKTFVFDIRYAEYLTPTCDNSLDHSSRIRRYVIKSESTGHIVAQCIYSARGDGRFTWHVLTIFISRAITWDTRGGEGLQETLITAKTYVNPFPETSMLDTLPSLHCFGRLFSTYNRRAILWPLRVARIRRSSPAARHRIGYTTHTGVVMFYG